MMKVNHISLGLCLLFLFSQGVAGQKKGLESIQKSELKLHMDILASDELQGRATGEPGLLIAARYLAAHAEKTGLKSAESAEHYFQYYTILERAYDWENSSIGISTSSGESEKVDQPFFIFPALRENQFEVQGEVVFAGYGVKNEENNYDDFENIDLKDKIVLIMDRAPLNEDGTVCLFGEKYMEMQNFQYKMQEIALQGPKAILLVFDPKSGYEHIGDRNPGIVNYLSKSRTLKKEETLPARDMPGPKMLLIHVEHANQLIASTGKSLEQIQNEIDANVKPQSFLVEDVKCKIKVSMADEELEVPNIFGYIEGSDPELKDEMLIYMAHFDHVGTDGQGGIFNGADDNASGTVALLEIAEAFIKEKKAPKRSIGFLWVSAEEIGLYGSSYFADHPLVPIENIAAAINMDMVGRSKTEEDRKSQRKDISVVGGDTVGVIGALQSKVLMGINNETLEKMNLVGDYTYNDINHPERFFYRSDHISFARKDIPVLFYSTGTHSDYHELTDDPEKIDYDKFLKMTKFCFMIGHNAANYKGEILVDNPMSGW